MKRKDTSLWWDSIARIKRNTVIFPYLKHEEPRLGVKTLYIKFI